MCILVIKPAGVKLPAKNIIQNCYDNNPDGCGMMWVEDGQVMIDKGLYDFETFYSKLLQHEEGNLVFHCRIKTHGEISQENCHPFKITDEFALAHNGILSVKCYEGKTDSESFGIDYMSHLKKEDLLNYKIWKILNEIVVHNGSKVAVMTNDDKIIAFNKEGFIKENGVYFSNGTFRYCRSYYSVQPYYQKKALKSGTTVVEGKDNETIYSTTTSLTTYSDSEKEFKLSDKLKTQTFLSYIKQQYNKYEDWLWAEKYGDSTYNYNC